MSKRYTKEEIKQMVKIVISDLKHQTPNRQEVNDKNIKRDLFFNIIRDMFNEENFYFQEKEADSGRMGLYIKGYVRDVWDFLMESYDLIHDENYVPKEKDKVVVDNSKVIKTQPRLIKENFDKNEIC